MANYELDLPFNTEIRKLDPKEPNHADTAFNPHFKQLVNNDKRLKEEVEEVETKLTQATQNIGALTAADIGAAPANHTHTDLAASNHTHTANDIGAAPENHGHTVSQIADFPASLPANGGKADYAGIGSNSSNYEVFCLRNIRISPNDPSGGNNGDVWFKYI